MLTRPDVRTLVSQEIHALLAEDDEDVAAPAGTDLLTEIGLNSLLLARLLIQLEAKLGVDPFTDGSASLADAQSVADLSLVYERALDAAPDAQ